MTYIYLVRHAEAEGNIYRRIQGQYDSDITELGKKQNDAVARRFANMDIAGVLCSSLKRAKSTAQAIADPHGLKIEEKAALKEINMGVWEDQPWGNLNRKYPKEMNDFIHHIENFSVPGSESIQSVQERVKKEIIKIGEEFKGKNVVVVSHGTAINALLSELTGLTFAEVKCKFTSGDNTAVSLIQYENGRMQILFCHDSSHLRAEISTYERQKKWRISMSQMDGTYFAPLNEKDLKRISDYDEGKISLIMEECIDKTKIMIEDQIVGMVFLKDEGQEKKEGRIEYCWIAPEYRRRRIGVQLIGHAVSFFRKREKTRVRIALEGEEKEAAPFFEKCGFRIEERRKDTLLYNKTIIG